MHPKIDNRQIVWQGYDNYGHDYDIYFWDGEYPIEVRQLTDNNYHEENPEIDNGQVTWQGYDGNDWEIFFWDSSELINQSPKADAGIDQVIILGESVVFNGSGSFDTDGTITSYEWSFGDGNTNLNVITHHKYSAAGQYTVTLTVIDNYGASDQDTMTIIVLTIGEALQDLVFGVGELDLPNGIKNSLISKLENTQSSFERQNNKAAINQLGAFVNEVEAQRGKAITVEKANELISEAFRIMNNI
ncbi:PKD domain-containing protein [Chloroflexota bacterium]